MPLNPGRWSRELSSLLKHLAKAATKQLERQHIQPHQHTQHSTQQHHPATTAAGGAPSSCPAATTSAAPAPAAPGDANAHEADHDDVYAAAYACGGDEVQEQEQGQEQHGQQEGQGQGQGQGHGSAAAPASAGSARPWASVLHGAELGRLVAACARLADRGQYSKDHRESRIAYSWHICVNVQIRGDTCKF